MRQNTEKTELECSGAGKLKCGNCVCESGFWGPSCECKIDAEKMSPDSYGCKQTQDNVTSLDCSGQGYCLCDKTCICQSPPGKKMKTNSTLCNIFFLHIWREQERKFGDAIVSAMISRAQYHQ